MAKKKDNISITEVYDQLVQAQKHIDTLYAATPLSELYSVSTNISLITQELKKLQNANK
jgi:hypothetical protein